MKKISSKNNFIFSKKIFLSFFECPNISYFFFIQKKNNQNLLLSNFCKEKNITLVAKLNDFLNNEQYDFIYKSLFIDPDSVFLSKKTDGLKFQDYIRKDYTNIYKNTYFIDEKDNYKAYLKTKSILFSENINIFFEPTFIYLSKFIAKCDILIRDNNNYFSIFEIKAKKISSIDQLFTKSKKFISKYKKILLDISYQYWILKLLNYQIKNVSLIVINPLYWKNNNESLYKTIQIPIEYIESNVPLETIFKVQQKLLSFSDVFEFQSDLRKDYCFHFIKGQHKLKNSIFNLYNKSIIKKINYYYKNNVFFLKHLLNPESLALNEKQTIQWHLNLNNEKTYIQKNKINSFLNKINFPICFFDFETWDPLKPVYNYCNPYQKLPFQFSIAIVFSEEKIEYFDYINERNQNLNDFAFNFFNFLKKFNIKSFLAYNTSFEMSVLNKLNIFTKYKYNIYIDYIQNNIFDLLDIFKSFWFYNTNFNGSLSIKSVLPSLIEGQNYSHFKYIKNGEIAAQVYRWYMDKNIDDGVWKKVKKELLSYCNLDTIAMIKLFFFFKNKNYENKK